MSRSAALSGWLVLTRVLAPLGPLLLARRARRGKEDPARMAERLGRPGLPRPPGRLVWLHGASVGEALTLVPLARLLLDRDPGLQVLVTTGTVTSARRLEGMLPARAVHQFVPIDTAPAVAGFLRHWRPDLAIFVESEIWPRLVSRTAAAGTPMLLVNARISDRSARGWARVPAMARALFGCFARIVTQDAATAAHLRALGVPAERVETGGNLKRLAPPPGCDAGELARLRPLLAGRPVWCAASTHPPEEALVAGAQALASARLPGLLCLLVPRHPERGDEIAALLSARGLATARRSRGEVPEPDTAVWLCDSMGELGLWYRLAQVSFIGGSVAPRGGHNPFEPAALGSAILHGPEVQNFAPAYAALAAAGAARGIADADGLAAALADLLAPDGSPTPEAVAMAEAARAVDAADRPDPAPILDLAFRLMEAR